MYGDTVPPLKVRRVLHFSVPFPGRLETYRGHTGGGKHWGGFLHGFFLFCPAFLLACLP